MQTSIGVGGFVKLSKRQKIGVLASLRDPKPQAPEPMTKAEKRALFDKQLAVMRGEKNG